ncbi:hypothetical protein D6D19_04564 [Aureobasidium pullulans]|jgi:hypothetical protein|uniref:Uncharacterized protein n=2 Tax=Aureobasidium pullulans TaxID=5580 RepID=A0A4S9A6K9_AURPU|nr:hypothetical protein D6D28_08440 [Aureobasidium pullulans]THW74756.1 hypothetical protein D6D19_04564 [Aureobasidium pullulans]THX70918.1 hypothetical protein D6D04_09728 [Aureobasidium pullulans]THY27321.1 hypothetical protein D6D00_05003 [Aureobasidium pullulans]THY88141.1 hypothetical protein D6C92_07759 [Aureobasidium pullulans]
MDSMRSLNTSLPRTSPRRTQQPPEELLSAFKAAALSVTNLYKNAASEQARSRAAGYQDALDDLLSFLDKENLGLGDGEGWRVRQWATERFDGGISGGRESEDEEEEQEEPVRSSSPEVARKPTAPQEQLQPQPQPQPEPVIINSEPIQQQQQPQILRSDITVPQSDTFSFRSSMAYPPPHHDREVDMDGTNSIPSDSPNSTTSNTNNPVRLEVHPRRRNNHNHNRSNNSNSNRIASVNLGSLGSGAGSKRKNLGDFFDISGLSFGNNGRDGSDRGGKRGRHV